MTHAGDDRKMQAAVASDREQVLDRDTFRRLVEEGQELRRAFEAQTSRTRVITADDMKIRSR